MAAASYSGLSGALASWYKLIAIGCSRALGLLLCLEPRLGKSLVAKVCVSLTFAWCRSCRVWCANLLCYGYSYFAWCSNSYSVVRQLRMQWHGMGYYGWPTCYSRHDLSSNGLDTCCYRLLAWAVVAWVVVA
ncbi:hypothetical protein U1Q18_011754 [Sarracenia purpurea var. burkii]